MSVQFDGNFNLVNLKSSFSLNFELSKTKPIPNPWIDPTDPNLDPWLKKEVDSSTFLSTYETFINKVVEAVKTTFLDSADTICTYHVPYPAFKGLLYTPQLIVVARALYRNFGIEIQQVDAMQLPKTIVVTWQRDHPFLNPPTPYAIKSQKMGRLADCQLKFGEKLFPAHKLVLACKSPYFEKMFESQCIEAEPGAIIKIELAGVEEKSVEKLLDYFYTGEINLENTSVYQIDNLVNFSSYFMLPHLEQICFEHLCKSVTPQNLKAFLALAHNYNHLELRQALVEHIRSEVTPENVESLIQLARSDNTPNLEQVCTEEILIQISKIPPIEIYGDTYDNEKLEKFFALALKLASEPILTSACRKLRIQLFARPRAMGPLPLKDLWSFLGTTCKYHTIVSSLGYFFDWCNTAANDLQEIKGLLYEKTLAEIQHIDERLSKGVRTNDSSVCEYHQTPELLGTILIANAFEFFEMKDRCLNIFINQMYLGRQTDKFLSFVKSSLTIAVNLNMQDLHKKCEEVLILEKPHIIDSSQHIIDPKRYHQIMTFADQWNLAEVKEAYQLPLPSVANNH